MKLLGNDSKGIHLPKEGGKFIPNKKILELRERLINFMEDHIYPAEHTFYKHAESSERWTVHPEEEKLKEMAKRAGLWNLWIPVCVFSNHLFPISIL